RNTTLEARGLTPFLRGKIDGLPARHLLRGGAAQRAAAAGAAGAAGAGPQPHLRRHRRGLDLLRRVGDGRHVRHPLRPQGRCAVPAGGAVRHRRHGRRRRRSALPGYPPGARHPAHQPAARHRRRAVLPAGGGHNGLRHRVPERRHPPGLAQRRRHELLLVAHPGLPVLRAGPLHPAAGPLRGQVMSALRLSLAGIAGLIAVAALPLLVRFALPASEKDYLHLLIQILLWAFIYTGWSLMGRFGLTSLGHGAFTGIGAYVTVMLWNFAGLSPWLGIPVAVALAALVGVIVG